MRLAVMTLAVVSGDALESGIREAGKQIHTPIVPLMSPATGLSGPSRKGTIFQL